MTTLIEIFLIGQVNESFSLKVRNWAEEVIRKTGAGLAPARISIYLWEKEKEFQEFDRREKAELGVVASAENNFLATHEAWRGFSRIHLSLEKVRGLPEEIIQGVVQHEIGHALFHGRPEFYRFLFSKPLRETARAKGLDLPQLQQLVYLLSVALKDEEVVRRLQGWGLGLGQIRLLEFLMEDTEEERQIWDQIKDLPVPKKLAWAVFFKILLPIETLSRSGGLPASLLINQWEKAYSWLSQRERAELRNYARWIIKLPAENFQDWLEQAVLEIIDQPSL